MAQTTFPREDMAQSMACEPQGNRLRQPARSCEAAASLHADVHFRFRLLSEAKNMRFGKLPLVDT
ncbi:MAG: hypothetical protein AAGK78_04640, partial [Planctomycetota bacterium]